ncbi:hypothetical protein TNCV_457551 [Trichonephila clavipes]|nr:hypothetical protein TNCV_457551 [Trichonephila clavipes]
MGEGATSPFNPLVATFLASRASPSAGRFFFVLSSCSRRHSAMSATCPCTCSTYMSLYSVSVHVSSKILSKRIDTLEGYGPPLGDTRDVRLGRVCHEHLRYRSETIRHISWDRHLITIHGKEFLIWLWDQRFC